MPNKTADFICPGPKHDQGARGNQERNVFTVCIRCNTILPDGSERCFWCGATKTEKRGLLAIAAKARAGIIGR